MIFWILEFMVWSWMNKSLHDRKTAKQKLEAPCLISLQKKSLLSFIGDLHTLPLSKLRFKANVQDYWDKIYWLERNERKKFQVKVNQGQGKQRKQNFLLLSCSKRRKQISHFFEWLQTYDNVSLPAARAHCTASKGHDINFFFYSSSRAEMGNGCILAIIQNSEFCCLRELWQFGAGGCEDFACWTYDCPMPRRER